MVKDCLFTEGLHSASGGQVNVLKADKLLVVISSSD